MLGNPNTAWQGSLRRRRCARPTTPTTARRTARRRRRARRAGRSRRSARLRGRRRGRRRRPGSAGGRRRSPCGPRAPRRRRRSSARAPVLPDSAVASSRITIGWSASTIRASASCCACSAVSAAPPSPTTVSRPSGSARDPVQRADALPAPRASSSSLGRGAREAQVVGQRAGEHVHLLADQADRARGRRAAELRELDAAEAHPAAGRALDARDDARERRLARAADADQRHPLAGRDREVDAAEHVVPVDVGVAHAVQDDRGVGRARRVRRLGGPVHARRSRRAG